MIPLKIPAQKEIIKENGYVCYLNKIS
jgi:hypothetical protein